MTLKQQITTFFKGMAMGIVNVIPVSSGTVSLIIGVFERFINSIKSLNLKAIITSLVPTTSMQSIRVCILSLTS